MRVASRIPSLPGPKVEVNGLKVSPASPSPRPNPGQAYLAQKKVGRSSHDPWIDSEVRPRQARPFKRKVTKLV
jgi:hypothetical protein